MTGKRGKGWVRRDCIAVVGAAAMAAALPGAAWAAAARSAPPVILVVGDSLSAEYGIARGSGWVALLERRLAGKGVAARVVNASVSGDTTAGGLARLPALLTSHRPTHVVLELGGNDALRGLPLASTEKNLSKMVQLARSAGAQVLLVGMQVPPNFGGEHARRFAELFQSVATQHKVAFVPFLLAGVADGPDPTRLFQADRIHPTAEAQPRMLDNVWPALEKLLR